MERRLNGRVAAVIRGAPGIGRAIRVAHGCVYLASDEARFVTGAELVIGYTAR